MKTAESKLQAEFNGSKFVRAPFFLGPYGNGHTFFGPASVQPKLEIGQPNDKYEQEAERVADEIVQSPTQQVQLQHDEEKLQLKSDKNNTTSDGMTRHIAGRLHTSTGRVNKLDQNLESEMEGKLGVDFSNVKVHTGSDAVQMNRQLQARAFTHGSNIYFNQGEYQPDTNKGKHLLAHELTHVAQQTGETGTSKRGGKRTDGKVKHSTHLRTSPNIIQFSPLTDAERRNIVEDISHEMNITHSDYNNGAQDAEQAIAAARSADAEVAKTIFAMGMALIVPGFGGIVAGGFTRFGVSVSTELASNIGNAIGEAAKSAGNREIDQQFGTSTPASFFISITEGWEEAARQERLFLQSNETNRSAVSDNSLRELYSYWVTLARNNRAVWSAWFQEQWRRYEQQVGAIGPQGTGMVPHGPTPLSNDNIPVRIRMENGSTRLALVNKTRVDFTSNLEWIFGQSDIRTRYRFLRWIDDDLADLAIAQVSSVPTISAGSIGGVP